VTQDLNEEQAMTFVQEAPPTLSRPAGLTVLRELFERLHAAGIRYCHWKSNEHLGASMTGATDVDVLVERQGIQRLTRILTDDTTFKRFVVKPGYGYPAIEDYIGFDPDTGILIHLHIHYQLTLGEKFIKGHRLPWEELYLSTRVLDDEHGVYVTDPHVELVVLIMRSVMKLRVRDVVLETLGKPYFRGGLLRELRWLMRRVDEPRLREVATALVGERAATYLPTILAEPALHVYRLYGRLAAAWRMAALERDIVRWKIKNWLSGAPAKSNRTLPQGGLFVALLGPDGAGKTTVTGEIAEWLSHEVAVMTTYGGSGTGSASLPRRVLQKIGALRRRLVERPAPRARHARPPESPPSRLRSLGRLLVALTLTRERRRRTAEIRRARGRGWIVLSDRFPQRQFAHLNDGPQLARWLAGPPGLRRAVARREQAVFRLTELTPPDLVIKLHVSPEVAAQRKPETPAEQLRNGIELLDKLTFPPTTRVVDVDAERPLAQVLLEVKRAVWERI
jgi:thymidylate kinase